MKTQLMMYMTVTYVATLKTKAEELGVPFSVLNEFLASTALQRIPAPQLEAWAEGLREPSPNAPKTRKQADILAALARLTTPETYRWDLGSVADAAGMPPREAYRALCALEGRGEVAGARGEALDRHGRPVESWWRLVTKERQG